jgi:hypothetical protein
VPGVRRSPPSDADPHVQHVARVERQRSVREVGEPVARAATRSARAAARAGSSRGRTAA